MKCASGKGYHVLMGKICHVIVGRCHVIVGKV